MKFSKLSVLILATTIIASCSNDSEKKKETVKDPVSSSQKKWNRLREDANVYFKALPSKSEDIENPSSAEKIAPSKFDKYLAGDDKAFTIEEKEGLKEFIDQGCIACHTGPMLGASMMQKFPIFGKYEDYSNEAVHYGKYEETKNEKDKFMFKVPTLRNIEKTAPYLHDSSKTDLVEVIKIMGKAELNKDITDAQAKKIETFLKTLTSDIEV